MYRYLCRAIALCSLLTVSSVSLAEEHTPFDGYEQVAPQVFVFDKSLFSKTAGPGGSQSPVQVSEDGNEQRERLGIIKFSPTQRVYVDVVSEPMSTHFELTDVKTGALIYAFAAARCCYSMGRGRYTNTTECRACAWMEGN